MTGGFDLEKIEDSTPTHFSALVKDKANDQFARLVLDVEPEAPHRISKFELLAISRPAEFAIPRLGQKEAIAALKKNLEHDSAADRFSGAGLVAKDGKLLFEQAYGMADREKKLPIQCAPNSALGR